MRWRFAKVLVEDQRPPLPRLWRVFHLLRLALDSLPLSDPLTLVVSGKKNKIEVKDVLVGDVFLCSGQSNMAMSMNACQQRNYPGVAEDIAGTDLPQVRIFQTPNGRFAKMPQEDVEGRWEPLNPRTNGAASAIAFYFGKTLHEHLKIPIGLVRSSYGGGSAEIKMPVEALRSVPQGQVAYESMMQRASPEGIAARNRELRDRHEREVQEARTKGMKLPSPPPPVPEIDGSYPSGDWNGVIVPVIRYTKRAILWYQGEHNVRRGWEYRETFPVLIRSWREAGNQGDLPFIFVQLPAFDRQGAGIDWPILRESQLVTLRAVRNTAMVVAIDHGERDDIHPGDKKPIAERLALETRRLVYGEAVSGCGPLFDGYRVEGSKIMVHFQLNAGELKSATGELLKGFTIAGEDRVFVPARAAIRGANQVELSSPEVPHPASVRYAWENFPTVSLFNTRGLPASPFRTDRW